VQRELKDDEALPKLLVVGIALIGLGLLIANTALVAWFIIRKRIKGNNKKKKSQSSMKTTFCFAAIFPLFVLFNLSVFSALLFSGFSIVGQLFNGFHTFRLPFFFTDGQIISLLSFFYRH
jgi:hypothetical protein